MHLSSSLSTQDNHKTREKTLPTAPPLRRNPVFVRAMLLYPPTWLALLTLIGMEWGLAAWFRPTWVALALTLVPALLLALLWVRLASGSRGVGKLYFRMIALDSEQERRRLREIEEDLGGQGFDEGVKQLQQLHRKLASLTEVLRRRLSAGELTYGRYLGAAEQVYLAAVDNLRDVGVALRSVSAIDLDYIDARLEELEKPEVFLSERDRKEIDTLRKRRALFVAQMQKVKELVAQNEAAMTVLDKTATVFATTRTAKGEADMDAGVAIADLERLAERIGRYSAGGRET